MTYVYIDIYTLQLCIIDLTQQGWHTLRLPSILEAVPPSTTWGRAMPWWQGPTYHGDICIVAGIYSFIESTDMCWNATKLHKISSIGSFMEVQTSTVAHLWKYKHVYCRYLLQKISLKVHWRLVFHHSIPAVFHLMLYRSAHKIHHCEGIRRLHQAQFFSAVQCLTDVTKSSFMLLFSA